MNCLKYLIKNEIDQEQFKLYLKYLRLEKEFEKNICSKCKGTCLQKKRECDFLFGFPHLACNYMTKEITKKMKEKNKKLIKKIITFQILSSSNAGKVI